MEHKIRMFIEIILAILLPPLGVVFPYGCCSCEFLISILLTILGFIPGILYSIFVIISAHIEHKHRLIYGNEENSEPFVV